MVKIYVDGKKYNSCISNNLLEACLNLGLDIPYFCWHPKLGSIGACRQCAIKKYQDKNDYSGKIVMSCMTPVENNSIITINDKESIIFRKNIIELLMLNHPHDCPVCEEGGNCHLQDMTVMNKHYSRRYRFDKRIYKSQYLGFFISHEMNRCISCYRCVRYYKDYADGKDFNVYGSNNNIYFGRFNDGELESEYSGNLIEICPTGVFTDKTYSENYSRKWDLQSAPSICSHCSIGCNIIAGERYNKIVKIENRYNENINNYFLCDLGRFGYGHSNSLNRLNYCYIKKKKKYKKISLNKNIKKIVKIIKNSKSILGIGSSRASLETNFSLKQLVGKKNFSTGMIDIDHKCSKLILKILKKNTIKIPTLKEVENYDSILILGEDITQTSSRLALSIRQALKKRSTKFLKKNNLYNWHTNAINNTQKNKKKFLFLTNTDKTKLEDVSSYSFHSNIQNQIYFSNCILSYLKKKKLDDSFVFSKEIKKKILYISNILLKSKKILIISGSHSRNRSFIKVAYNISLILKNLGYKVGLILLTPNVNSLGVSIIKGKSLEKSLNKVQENINSTLIIVENDLFYLFHNSYLKNILTKFKNIIVMDHQRTKTVKKSNIIFPVSNFFESTGTVINYELRAQRFFKVYNVNFYNKNISTMSSWRILNIIKSRLKNKVNKIKNLDDLINLCVKKIPFLKNIKNAAPKSSFKVCGQKIPRSTLRSSGRTSLRADIDVHEIKQIEDNDSMFSFSMEGSTIYKNYTSIIPFIWSPQWNSSQGLHKFQKKISGRLLTKNSETLLISKKKNISSDYFKQDLNFFVKNKNLIIVPYYSLFGSEELSQYSEIIKNKNSLPYLFINELDAKNFNISNKKKVTFTCLNDTYSFFAIYSNFLESGQVALPIGQFKTSISLIGKQIQDLKEV
ncbi:NADH-quinone oxidoreductase subunit NuoG [Buchnera aphidicola (Periphyllus koelreuteriae)]|uniref:NADH-quinone oxidoreductase subunit NuoG n=1 Tax=Buchnera aphidicola TaxID=9 RepID=UPI0031B899D6